MTAYQAGLQVEPRHVLLNFSLAELNLKAGIESVARDHLARCLKYAPAFYPAHVMLGEIALGEVERTRASLLLRYNAGEAVDFGIELVPPMKAAAAFFNSALTINPNQPATKQALATLYLQLSEFAPLVAEAKDAEAVRRGYLLKAREVSRELIDALEAMVKLPRTGTPTERELAAIPSLACYNTYAFALYSLGEYDAALAAFKQHLERIKLQGALYMPGDNKRRDDYAKGPEVAYAEDWVRRIEQNQRQYFKVEEFKVDSKPGFYGAWNIPTRLKPDSGFVEGTRISGGKLQLAVDQKESGVISRIETEQPYNTLSVFQADFVKVGENPFDYGICVTKVTKQSDGTESKPRVALLLGVDPARRVFWETRKYDVDATSRVESRLNFGVIDVADYGGVPLKPGERLSLAIRRQRSRDLSDLEYVAIINGYEVRLPISVNATGVGTDELTDTQFSSSYALHCGFFTRAGVDIKGTVEVEEARFIYDSGLGK
jgi:tetratricopeptide (TPR) repeat protein